MTPALSGLLRKHCCRRFLDFYTGAVPCLSARASGQFCSRFVQIPRRQQSTRPRTYVVVQASGTSTFQTAGSPQQLSDDSDGLWLIVGLGNPGPQYDGTRHNVGFEVVDLLGAQLGVRVTKIQDNAAVARGVLCGQKVVLAKPMTFMNNSGESVRKLARYYKVPSSRVLVIYDDLDIAPASVRLRGKGGHGGHNGMRSISAQLGGTQDFPRVRIGIGRPAGQMPVAAYVLQKFKKEERESVDVALQEALDVVRSVLTLGVDKALSGVRV